MGAFLVVPAGTKLQGQHSAKGTLPKAVPDIGMQIIFNESSLCEYRGCRAVVRTEPLARLQFNWIRGPASKPRLTASAACNSLADNLLLGLS
jgi:hypothetical protein